MEVHGLTARPLPLANRWILTGLGDRQRTTPALLRFVRVPELGTEVVLKQRPRITGQDGVAHMGTLESAQ